MSEHTWMSPCYREKQAPLKEVRLKHLLCRKAESARKRRCRRRRKPPGWTPGSGAGADSVVCARRTRRASVTPYGVRSELHRSVRTGQSLFLTERLQFGGVD